LNLGRTIIIAGLKIKAIRDSIRELARHDTNNDGWTVTSLADYMNISPTHAEWLSEILGEQNSPYLERKPQFTRKQFETVRDMLAKGTSSMVEIARATGVKRPTVYRLKDDPAAAEAALVAWGCEHRGERRPVVPNATQSVFPRLPKTLSKPPLGIFLGSHD
jgi:hypothetical protein